MSKLIKISTGVAKKLDELRHPGQTYDGIIREILEKVGAKVNGKGSVE